MITNPNLILYACVAKGTTILSEFNSKDADLGALAAKCLHKTPPLHSIFSHTVCHKTYTFFMDEPFVYFAIFDDKLDNSQGLSFLKSVRDAFHLLILANSVKRLDNLKSHCFQGEFNPVFHNLLSSDTDMDTPCSPRVELKHGHSGSFDFRAKNGSIPLLLDASKSLKKKNKKKRFIAEMKAAPNKELTIEKKLEVSDDGISLSRDFPAPMQKGGLYDASGHQKAKRVWKKQVWVVLSLDLIVCAILFAVWLWICRGFKCIDT